MVTSLTTSHQFSKDFHKNVLNSLQQTVMMTFYIAGTEGKDLDKPIFIVFKGFTCELPTQTI
jgi:hypothetical protein